MSLIPRSKFFDTLHVRTPLSALRPSRDLRGARVSPGPRGNYVSFGPGGFAYGQKLSDSPTAPLSAVNGDALVHEASARTRKFNAFHAYLWLAGVVLVVALCIDPILLTIALVAACVGAALVWSWDTDRRTTRIFYDVDSDDIVARLALCNFVGESLSRSARLWHVFSSSRIYDRKYNAGASSQVQRIPTSASPGPLRRIYLNIDVWSVGGGVRGIMFLPDRIVVQQGANFGWAPYDSITIEHEVTRFIETQHVPPDAQVVDTTWQFVNKSGGPDRRFNNNRALPVLAYGRLVIRSSTGLYAELQSSRADVTAAVASALQELVRIAQTRATVVRAPQVQAAPPPSARGLVQAPHSTAMPIPVARPPEIRPTTDASTKTQRPMGAPFAPQPGASPSVGSHHQRRFVGAPETISVAGYTISRPLTYVSGSVVGADASTIVTSLQVGYASRATQLPYWPVYSEADPDQRARYLEWMAGGRIDPTIEIGYVFMFFYGLEWRALRDGADVDLAVEEVARLLSLYGERSGSLRSYAGAFVTMAAVRSLAALDEASIERMLGDVIGHSESAMGLLLAWYAQRARPLPARHAFAYAATMEGIKGGVVVQRSRKELEDLFSARYKERFGDGISMEVAKRPLLFEYRPASATWLRSGHKLSVSLPNVAGKRAQFAPLVTVWNQCVDELRRASSLMGKNDGNLSAEAWAALPAELRAQYDHPDRDRWDATVSAAPHLAGFHVLKAENLAKLVGVAAAEKLTAAQHRKVTETAADLGYAIEPDGRVLRDGVRAADDLLVWKTKNTACPDPTLYASVYTITALAMVVAMADGVLMDDETRVTSEMLGSLFALDDDLRRRLEALQQLLARQPARATTLAKRLKASRSQPELLKLGRLLVAVAAADGSISDEEHKALQNLYKALGLAAADLAGALAASGGRLASDEPVEVRAALPSSGGEKLPAPPDAQKRVKIDHSAVAAILADTRDVAAILAEVLDRDDDEPASTAAPTPSPSPLDAAAASPELAAMAVGLDVRYHAALEDLLAKSDWTVAEIRALATRRNLMPGAIVETINAWADDAFGDFLIDESDGWHVRRELVKREDA